MTWPAILLWILCVVGLVVEGPLLLYIFFVSICFGTLLMLPIEANVMPQIVTAAFLFLKILSRPGNLPRLIETSIMPGRGGLFSLFVLYSLVSGWILPRLFAGQVQVVPVSNALAGATLLAPSSGNYTQAGYLIASFCTVIGFGTLAGQPGFYRYFLRGTLVLGLTLVITGVVDYLSYYGGFGTLLDPFRNASYNLLTDVESAGTKRAVGLLAEASVYGSSCVTAAALLIFLRPCYASPTERFVVALTALALVAMAILSTSSSAYAGLGIFAAMYGVNWLMRFGSTSKSRSGVFWELGLVTGLLLAVCALIALSPQLSDTVMRMADVIIFEKDQSASYFERSMWTRTAWKAFLDTGGAGVGYGSVRVSNWFVAILSSTGLFGGLLLLGFLLLLFLRPVRTQDFVRRETVRAVRLSLIPTNVMYWFGGTIPDIGVWVACCYGVLLALTNEGPALSADETPSRAMAPRGAAPLSPRGQAAE